MNGALGMRLQDALNLYNSQASIPPLNGAQSTPHITETGTRSTLRIWVRQPVDTNKDVRIDHVSYSGQATLCGRTRTAFTNTTTGIP